MLPWFYQNVVGGCQSGCCDVNRVLAGYKGAGWLPGWLSCYYQDVMGWLTGCTYASPKVYRVFWHVAMDLVQC